MPLRGRIAEGAGLPVVATPSLFDRLAISLPVPGDRMNSAGDAYPFVEARHGFLDVGLALLRRPARPGPLTVHDRIDSPRGPFL